MIERIEHCLVRAATRRGVKCLLAQRRLLPVALTNVLAAVERDSLPEARRMLADLLATAPGAHWLSAPAEVALVGPPNAGKSNLANRLAGRDAAIVSARTGTTRDWVTLPAAVDGVPLTLVDTAGLRDATDNLEDAAICAGRRRSASADFFLLVVDGVSLPGATDLVEWCGRLPAGRTLLVANKSDLGPTDAVLAEAGLPHPVVAVSARTGAGLGSLSQALLGMLDVPSEAIAQTQALVVDRELRRALAGLLADKHATSTVWARGLRDMLGRL